MADEGTLIEDTARADHAFEAGSTTRRLAALVAGAEYEDLPDVAIERARIAVQDYAGCAVAGARSETAVKLLAWLPEIAGAGPCTIPGTAVTAGAAGAALASGTLAHALDYDDMSWMMLGHPGVSILPALFALGESRHASGADVVLAYVVGFEVASRLGATVNRTHYERGWHATGTLGALGAAAGAARLLGLDERQAAAALAIAASLASGLRANFGTDTKPLHAGRAAENGVLAALFAQRGFTAAPDVLEAPSGFLRVFGDASADPARVLEGFADPWAIADPGFNTKGYPSCMSTHAAIDGTLELVRRDDVRPEQVAAVDVGVVGLSAKVLIHDHPRTGLEGKFSMQYCVARAICSREVLIDHFTDEAVHDPAVRSVLERVTMVVDEEIDSQWRVGTPRGARCTITLRDGRRLSTRVDWPTGSVGCPLSREQLRRKYLDCVRGILSDETATSSLERLEALESVGDIREITRSLTRAVH